MVPGSRPLMAFVDTRDPDVILPRMIAANAAARAEYDQAIARAWAAKNRLLALGVPMDVAETVTRMLQRACDEIGPDKDLTTVVQPVERRAGIEVRSPRE